VIDACYCTLAIQAPYRRRARQLCADLSAVPWIVLTDEPDDFADLPVRALRHRPTGPMATDYVERLPPTGNNRGGAAYHDKRFVLQAALRDFDSAIFLDADVRVPQPPAPRGPLPPGLAVLPGPRESIADALDARGQWRAPIFADLARDLMGDAAVLKSSYWISEWCYAVTRDGREARFFEAWDRAAAFIQERGVFSGEGGVMGLIASYAGWEPDGAALAWLAPFIQHEANGPKTA
jgi:hypothetical protein